MFTNKVFLRKTKRGNILKIIREHYLRTDLWCGSTHCVICSHEKHDLVLSENPVSQSEDYKDPHYLLLDTNVILDQIDVFEEDTIKNVIILQTVLDEVKHKSAIIYKRLRDILANPERRFYTFVNEHHRDTYIERLPKESSNDRNDRAIRKAVNWYENHLSKSQKERKGKKIRVLLLTDDADNRMKAEADGIITCSVRDYIKSLTETPYLQDKLCLKEYGSEHNSNPLCPPHLTLVQIHDGIKNGKLYQGSFSASRENFLEGSVNSECFEKAVLIQGRESLNRAVDGDIVAIELLPEDQWTAPSEIVLEDKTDDPTDDEINDQDENEKLLLDNDNKKERQPTGRIVGIIKRKWRQYCGILVPNILKGSARHIFIPAEKKIPRVRIETRQAEKLYNQRIIVAIDQWPRHSRHPQGHFVRALGPLGDKDTENEVLLIEHDIAHCKFSDEVLSCLPKLPWIIKEQDYKDRVDLRKLSICSVDPPGCSDIDDALHSRHLTNGNIEVGVHIADVSHFIRPGNAMDKEAASRATTVYLVDKRIDMVPGLLSSNLCSLRGNEERFAFSCIWEIDENANIIKTKFHKSVIKSKAALTYEEAQIIIDDKNVNDDVAKSLRLLNKLAKILRKRRQENGALNLASPEIRFNVDRETLEPLDVQVKEMLETNSMVEEFMLLANCSVAERIEKEFPEYAMLRRHPTPPQTNFDPLIKAVRHQGFDINTESNKALADSLDRIVKDNNPYFNTMLRILATRCMLQAVYFISGTLTKPEFYHYGLAAPIYTHFTSPIRRYADIIVHRLLAAYIGADSPYSELLDKTKNSLLCNNLNYRNRMAQYAGRASVALNTHLFFRHKTEEVDGYVLFVRKNALQILVPKYGLEGTIYLSGKNQESVKFIYNEENQTQQCGNVVFHSFDPVVVRLSLNTTNVQHEKLEFQMVKPTIEGFSVKSVNDDAMETEETTVESTSIKRTQKDSGSKKSKKKKN